jgi:hypothetical protein
MNFAKSAVVCVCFAFAAASAQAEGPDAAAHNLAAQCAGKNGLFDPDTQECAVPSEDSAAGDLVVGPMMKVLGDEAKKEVLESDQ